MSSLLAKYVNKNIGHGISESIKLVYRIRFYNIQHKFLMENGGTPVRISPNFMQKSSRSYEQEMLEQKALKTAERLEQTRLEAIKIERKCTSERINQKLQQNASSKTPVKMSATASVSAEKKKAVKKPQATTRMAVPELPEMKVTNKSTTNSMWSIDN